jgi:hypothetical protein
MSTTKINCIDNIAYQDAATKQANAIKAEAVARTAVQVGLLLWQRYRDGLIADLRQELSNRRMQMAEAVLDHAKKAWEKEASFVQEVMDQPAFAVDYSRMAAVGQTVEKEWKFTDNALIAAAEKVGLPITQSADARTGRGMATAKVDLIAHTMRTAEARAIALNDRRYSRQHAVLALGRGLLREAAQMGQLSANGTVVRAALIDTINSGMKLWGYESRRWAPGGNWATGGQGAPSVVPQGSSMYEVTNATGATSTIIATDALGKTLTEGN